ncbi:MAG: shikimate dehydrogenase, partial [Synergistales bacterium]|nr:shikimate dehydrogenase [Synergistales bacterium]
MATAATGLLCLLGDPVDHSLSPVIQGAALRRLDLDMAYLAFRVERRDFGAALRGLAALGCRGCNVTVPFKEEAAAAVDSLSPEARALGSVNTVLFAPGMTCGYNTDVAGIARTLEGLEPPRRGALLLGAGGAARAAGYVLARNGYGPVTVSNRGRDRAERLAADLRSLSENATITVLPWGELPERPPGMVVNATSLGLAGNPWPAPMPAQIA